MEIKVGQLYRHYKDHVCKVIGIGRHTETLEELVFYVQLGDNPKFGKDSVWARPKDMWFKKVEWQGKKVTRFVLIKK